MADHPNKHVREALAYAEQQGRTLIMSGYRFSLIVPASTMTYEQILDATDALGNANCTDASVRGHVDGMELLFERAGDSLQAAISSAITDVELAGYRVSKVELEREAVLGQAML